MAEETKAKKPGLFARIGKWFRELKSECRKIVWPTREQTINNTLVVLASVVIIGIFIWVLDLVFGLGYSGYENKVASSIEKAVENRRLHDLITAVNIPTEKVVEVKDGKSREVERKLYPGYVLVKMVMTDETWYLVRTTRGCTGFLGQDKSGGSKPIPLTEEEIIAMGVEKREIEVNYAAGDSVRVIDGPLAGVIGVVSSVEPDKNKVDVTVSMFGRETPVELELDQVETLDE